MPLSRATSIAYSWLQYPEAAEADGHRRKWSEELQEEITDKHWRYACILTHKCSISTKMQETDYKLLTQWYYTPDKLHRWDPQKPDSCWRCQKEIGTMNHVWWSCPSISAYWDGVRELIRKITEPKLNLNVACCLLHVTNYSFKRYKHSLTRHLLNAAK